MPEQKRLKFGAFVLDPAACSLTRAGMALPLRPKSFDVLLYLARNPGRAVSKDELMERIWPDVTVTDNSLVQCTSDIRAVLGADAQAILKTIPRRGYLFTATVTDADVEKHSPGSVESTAPPTSSRPRLVHISLAAAAVVAAVAGLFLWSHNWIVREQPSVAATAPEPAGQAARLSIAVLPFVTLGDRPQDDYFARGLTEDVISALGRFPDLSVRSANAVLPYQDKSKDPMEIGRELGVRYLAAGTIRQSAGRVRVSIQLADTRNGSLLWADHYDRDPSGIFIIQDDITRRIAGALAVRLTQAEQARVAAKAPETFEAYDFVLRGRGHLSRLTRSSTSEARLMFEQAVALDPNYAAAYLGLGTVDLRALHHGWTSDPTAALERALGHAYKAITLDEFNPQGHALLGRIFVRLLEYDRAADALRRAMALNPSDPANQAGLGDALLWSGDIEGAIAALEAADQSDPQISTQDLFNLGTAYFLSSDFSSAARVFERAAARNEGNPFVQAMLAAIYQEAARPDDARRAIVEMRRLNPLFDMERFGSLLRNPKHRGKIELALQKAAAP